MWSEGHSLSTTGLKHDFIYFAAVRKIYFDPPFQDMTVATNYEGMITNVKIEPKNEDLTYRLIDIQNEQTSSVNFFSTNCSCRKNITTTNLRVSCITGHDIQIFTNRPIAANVNMTLVTYSSSRLLASTLQLMTKGELCFFVKTLHSYLKPTRSYSCWQQLKYKKSDFVL